MKSLSFILCLNVFLAVNAQNVTDAKGKKQGVWSKTYPKSVVYQYKGQFKDDKPYGTFSYFYPSGNVKAIIKYDDNSTRSVAYFYHENKNLMSSGIFRNQKKDSIWLNFTPAGRLSSSETYKNDLLNGEKLVYYVPESLENKSRLILSKYNYLNGKLNGESIEYFENGNVKSKGTYALDKKVGVWDFFNPNGTAMMKERYKDGVHHGWHFAYDENGKETSKKYFYYGTILEGKKLEEKMRQMKELGINPNG